MTDNKQPFHNPFGALASLRGKDSTPPSDVPEPAETSASPSLRKHPRAIVRLQRAGRGGKEATVVEQLNLTPVEREDWLNALKAALGCGGNVEGDSLMLQGDHRKRLPKLLAQRGVKKVTLGT